ncbi:DUF2188 domain-containing protein [Microbacterium paludicola]|uniref:DUF2188 domain-containing protein n=1 Tax=Microbacterium paludicola TaxID=300019 RepID=UPI000904516F|nr:DUF2188 domain-containing protein [Microbacterium paludicola]APF32855.1 hypothetical protein BO218_00460 [Microbacterium paludicola]
MARTNYYVSPNGSDWKLTSGGTTLATDANKAPVVAKGREIAKKNQPSELFIQNADGTIADKETYGNDPYPPRG